jgi:Zn-dependent protease/CBS domain-containing protein
MKWSIPVGRVLGISMRVHITFLLLIGFLAIRDYMQGGWTAALDGVGFVLALFACVLLHEFGHALAARQFGIPTLDIELLPIGGVARLQRMPERPLQEAWVAIVGPLVNVAIALIIGVWLAAAGGFALVAPGQLGDFNTAWLQRLLSANLSLVLFNLIPAFPMDGGHILRALLALGLGAQRATQIASLLGQGLAFVLGFAGFFGNPLLIVVAVFIWLGAGQEASAAATKSALAGLAARRAMLTDFQSLAPDDSLERATELLLSGSQREFPVVEGGRVLGQLTRTELVRALGSQNQSAPVGTAMDRQFVSISADEPLEDALERLQTSGHEAAPVLADGRLVGLLTNENLGEFLMIQAVQTLRAQMARQG